MRSAPRAGISLRCSVFEGAAAGIVLVCVVVAAGAGYVYAKQQPTTYEASANLLLRDPAPGPANTNFGTPTPDTAPDREALVLSEPVKERTIKVLAPDVGGVAAATSVVADAKAVSGRRVR